MESLNRCSKEVAKKPGIDLKEECPGKHFLRVLADCGEGPSLQRSAAEDSEVVRQSRAGPKDHGICPSGKDT